MGGATSREIRFNLSANTCSNRSASRMAFDFLRAMISLCQQPAKKKGDRRSSGDNRLRRSCGMDRLIVSHRHRTRRTRASIRTMRTRPASCGLLPRTCRSPQPSLPRFAQSSEGDGSIKRERGERCAKVFTWSGTPYHRVVSHSNAWFATRAAPTPSARKAIPVSPIPASTTATRKEPRRRAISRRGGTVSTKMTRNPSARRKTATPYTPAAARSGRAAISRPMAALAIILWRVLQHMPNVDGFAPSQILHLPPSKPRRPDGTDFALVPHRNFVAGPNLMRCVSDSNRENVAHREEVLDLDPVGVLLGEDFAPCQSQGKHAARGVHRELLPSSEHPDIGKTASERRPFDEAQSGVAELEAGEVRHLLREARTPRHGPDGTRHLIQRPGQRDERIL